MEVGKLTVQYRGKTGKGVSRVTRAGGAIPGVCYGADMEAPIAVTVDPKALKASLDPERRRNTVIDVTIEREGSPSTTIKAMLWDFQVDAIKQVVTHVDLKSIDPSKAVEAEVPVVPVGTHKGQINGGLISWARHTVKILAKPDDIPAKLVLDISPLDLGDTLHIEDIPLPEDVVFSDSVKLTVATCIAPKGLKSENMGDSDDDTDESEEEDKPAATS